MRISILSISTLILFFFCCFSCTSDDTSHKQGNGLWNMEEAVLQRGKDIDVTPYNTGIEKALSVRLPWAYSPLTIALKVAGQQMISPEVNIVAKSLSGKELVTDVAVLVEKRDLQDDSVANEYFWIRMSLGGSVWQVAEIKHAWQCKDKRGSQDLTTEKCK